LFYAPIDPPGSWSIGRRHDPLWTIRMWTYILSASPYLTHYQSTGRTERRSERTWQLGANAEMDLAISFRGARTAIRALAMSARSRRPGPPPRVSAQVYREVLVFHLQRLSRSGARRQHDLNSAARALRT